MSMRYKAELRDFRRLFTSGACRVDIKGPWQLLILGYPEDPEDGRDLPPITLHSEWFNEPFDAVEALANWTTNGGFHGHNHPSSG